MKKIILLLFVSLYFLSSNSQSDNTLYLYVNNQSFWPAALGYKAVLGIKSKDVRFWHDNYYFKINYRDIDYQTLYSLGTPIDISTIDYINDPLKYFKNYTNWELHEKFSLHKFIFIITEIPENKLAKEKDKTKTYIMFPANYVGTQKNATWMNNTGKRFIDQ